MKEEICYGAIPIRKRKDIWQVFLLHHRKGNYFGFCKGHVEKSENPKKTLQRELFEETNLKVIKILSEKKFFETYSFYREKEKILKKVYYYLVKVSGRKKFQKEEILDGFWLSFEEAFSKITFEESKQVLKKVKNFLFKTY